ncbi:MAG: PQQ-dependent sugar dehydrogenase, partial [Caldilineaceae bacterium]|nr:PQQ-dependent sugar dehydrogenase [Caldilineaceae bacterium]
MTTFQKMLGATLALALIAGCAMPSLPQLNNQPVPETTDTATATIDREAVAPTVDSTATPVVEATTPPVLEATESPTVTTTARLLVPTVSPADTAAATATQGDTSLALPPADNVSARLQVPSGFAVRLFADGLNKPRLMTMGPDGMLYVADQNAGEVIRLPDADGDGLADEQQVIADGLTGAHSVEWFTDWLYVASYGQINRLQDADGDGTFETQELVTDNIPGTGGHSSRTLHFGPDGMLYVAAGSTSNNEPERDPRRATIMRFNPDGTIPTDNPFVDSDDERRQAVWAEGLRNSVDFLFLPDGRLWADHNGSDMLGDNLPPEEIVIEVEQGKHYGWPYCYTPVEGVVPPGTEEVRDERVELDPNVLASCSEAIPALFTDLAHYAPLGMVQYNADAFPAAYQGNLFVAYHGSWNSTDRRDCRVQMIVVQN